MLRTSSPLTAWASGAAVARPARHGFRAAGPAGRLGPHPQCAGVPSMHLHQYASGRAMGRACSQLQAALQLSSIQCLLLSLRPPTSAACSVPRPQSHSTVGRLVGGRHWLALRRFGGRWWNLDSNLPAPRLVAECCCSTTAAAPSRLEAAAGRGPAGKAAAAAAAGDCSTAHGNEAEGADPPVAAERDAGAAAAVAADPGETAAAGSDDGAAGQEAQQAAGSAAAAADEAAVRRFLTEQVQRHDAKVFVVVDSPIESHPLQDSPEQLHAAVA